MKTSLDAGDSKESTEFDKLPLHLKFLKQIHICEFTVLIF